MDESFELKGDPQERAALLDALAKGKFGMTAVHPASDGDGKIIETKLTAPEGAARVPKPNPFSVSFSTVIEQSGQTDRENLKQCFEEDLTDFCNFCQMHKCNGYCLKKRRSKKRKKGKKTEEDSRQVLKIPKDSFFMSHSNSRNLIFCFLWSVKL